MLFEHYRQMAEKSPDTAGVFDSGKLTPYAAVAERVEHLASGLLAAGIVPGDRVAVIVSTSVAFHEISYALFALGAVVVPVNVQSAEAEWALVGAKCDINAAICRNDRVAAAEAILVAAGRPKAPLITLGNNPGRDIETLRKVPAVRLPVTRPEADAVFLFSSGSTGRPKVVPHTHAEFMALGSNSKMGMQLTPEDTVFNPLPAHHAFGFMSAQVDASFSGASTCFWNDPAPLLLTRNKMLECIETAGVTVMPGVPFVFRALAGSASSASLKRVRLAYSGGVALDRETFESFGKKFGVSLQQGLGTTEAGHITLTSSAQRTPVWQTIGKPIGRMRVEVHPAENSKKGEGELFVMSETVTRGYRGEDTAANAGFFGGGYLTGDLGYINEEGCICITGRAKLILEIAGEKVDPAEIEDVLLTHPGITEAVVVSVTDSGKHNRLKAVVVSTGVANDAEVIRHCRTKLSSFKVPELVEFRDEIPRSATGKILRGKLMDG